MGGVECEPNHTAIFRMPTRANGDVDRARVKVAEESEVVASDFEAVMLPHRAAVLAVALRLCGNLTEANDLVQDTYERALRRYGSFSRGSNGRAWLVTILHNLFVDRCRRARVRPVVVPIDSSTSVAAAEPSEQEAWAEITMEQLEAALSVLEPDFRDVFRMHAMERRSYDEITLALGIPKATIGTRLLRARRKLRAMLSIGDDEEVG
jgi:RNA polymerase sigma-70 factor (ECF subfamily)